jgi:hypothetical protein
MERVPVAARLPLGSLQGRTSRRWHPPVPLTTQDSIEGHHGQEQIRRMATAEAELRDRQMDRDAGQGHVEGLVAVEQLPAGRAFLKQSSPSTWVWQAVLGLDANIGQHSPENPTADCAASRRTSCPKCSATSSTDRKHQSLLARPARCCQEFEQWARMITGWIFIPAGVYFSLERSAILNRRCYDAACARLLRRKYVQPASSRTVPSTDMK